MGKVRAAVALVAVALVTLVLAPIHYSALHLGFPRKTLVPMLWHRVAMRATGTRVRVIGELASEKPLMLVCNHASWADIMVIGSTLPVSFIAKSEVAGWPFVGWLARMQRSVFVERDRKRSSGKQASDVSRRMSEGDAILLFAEGTTGDGNYVLPFKSTLFGAAKLALDDGFERVFIQPMTIAYTRYHGLPMGRMHRALISWVGDTDLAPQIWKLLQEGGIDVELRLGAPVPFDVKSNRKAIAAQTEEAVRSMLVEALRNPA